MKLLRLLGFGAAALVALAAIAAVTAYTVSNAKLQKRHAITVTAPPIPADAAARQRGEHLALTRGCRDCHGTDLGGAKVVEDGAMGRLYGPNLTRGRGGLPATWTDADWVRAIRHGVAQDGRGLFLMPSYEYAGFTEEDFGALVAYLKSVPPVDRERVPVQPGPVARVLVAVGKIKLAAEMIDHGAVKPTVVQPGVTVEYGRYLAAGCTGCHGPNFSGGKIDIGPPDWPAAANLTPHESGRLAKWSEEDFLRAMREAKRPDGTALNPVMPAVFGKMTDVELKALWQYFRTLPPAATGAR